MYNVKVKFYTDKRPFVTLILTGHAFWIPFI